MKLANQNKPSGPVDRNSSPTRQGNRSHEGVLVLLVIIVFITGLSALLVGYRMYQPQVLAWLQLATPTYTLTPTPPCEQSTLGLGAYIYPLEAVAVAEDGTLPTLGGPAGTAFWISDTFSPYVILYEPAIRNLSLLDLLTPGDLMVIQSADCRKEEFILTDRQPGSADVNSWLEQTAPGIVVVVQAVGTSEGYVLHGQQSQSVNPPAPMPSQP